MTLDDLLALLPDNDTGAIDAADLRTIVTALWGNDEALEARVAALEAGGGTGGGGSASLTGKWQVNPDAGGVPGTMQVTAESASLAASTWLRFSKIDQANADMTAALMTAVRIYGQRLDDASTWVRYTVDGPATDGGTYIEVPVGFEDSEGSISSAQWQAALVVLTRNL